MPGLGKVGLGLSVPRGTSGVAADIAPLVTALGGDASVPAFYDVRKGVTVSTGVSQWDDARGSSGFGPSMVQATGANQPTWDAVNLTMTSDGVSKLLSTPLSSKFDISGAVTLVYVGSVISGAGICALRDGLSTPLFKMLNASVIAATVFGTSGSDLGSTTSVGTTRRVVIARKTALANQNTIQVPDIVQQGPGTSSTAAAGNRQCIIGASADAAEWGSGVWRALIVISHATSAGENTAIRNWAVTNHAAVAA